PPLSAVRAFDAAARHKSFRLAAVELGVTPSAISHQVKALETWIGTPLFVRVGRDVRLSAAGGLVAAKVMHAFELLGTALDAARREASET
ncbi:LysR family transcriptional regulator, partial [Acinetobacter baumannii]